MRTIKQDLAGPGVEVRETHISWVFLRGGDVWKVKKPVALGFLDFSSAEKRRAACESEVDLNRRLAPDVYLGVVPVTRDGKGRHRLGTAEHGGQVGDGRRGGGQSNPDDAVDWAVHMRRLPDADRGDHRLQRGALTSEDIEMLACRLAAFHAAARADDETARFGTVEAIRANVRENFEQSHESIRGLLSSQQAAEIEDWQLGFLDRCAALFDQRRAAGRIRDGHGDLRLEHVYFRGDGAVNVLDCIEFNERFRYADVCADAAFLSMDLAWHGRVDLAEHFLAVYARESKDYDLYPLVDFYQSYRAYVRGKVASMMAADAGAGSDRRERAAEEARRYFLLALASERRLLLPPALVAVGGLIGSGKSTVAGQLGAEMSAAVVDSDRTRKHLAGVPATQPLLDATWQGAYSPQRTEEVYTEVFRRAAAVLESGRPVVLDASFRSRQQRVAAKDLADRCGVPFYFVECTADIDLIRARLRRRREGAGVSDGREEILDDLVAAWEPVDETVGWHLIVDTSQPLEDNVAALARQLPTWPPGLTE